MRKNLVYPIPCLDNLCRFAAHDSSSSVRCSCCTTHSAFYCIRPLSMPLQGVFQHDTATDQESKKSHEYTQRAVKARCRQCILLDYRQGRAVHAIPLKKRPLFVGANGKSGQEPMGEKKSPPSRGGYVRNFRNTEMRSLLLV